MNYAFNIESLKRIINSDTVPNNKGGLDFTIEGIDITIKKPYIDDDGDAMDNSIFIDSNSGLQLSMRIEKADDYEFVFVFYRIDENKFVRLNGNSPTEVQNFANKIWMKIVEDVQERENAPTYVPNVLTKEKFSKAFGSYAIPDDLLKLFDFADENDHYDFSENFFLTTLSDAGLKTWSEEMEFRNSFIEFASANGTGSDYGFWLIYEDLNKCPIVIFGDEGGIHIIAENIRQLLHLLTFDIEPTVTHDAVYFFKDEDDEEYEHSGSHEAYIKWVEDNFSLTAITSEEETKKIIEAAQKKYQNDLNRFLIKFGIEI